ncbi:MAG: cupin domain-containing protein [Luteolibacter sp.]
MSPEVFPKPALVPPGTPRVIRAFGDELHVHLDASHTGGQFSMFIAVTPPGGGPPPHIHQNEDEWFHVLEGRAEFFLDGVWTEGGPGTTVFMPRNSFHTFRNVGDVPLKQIVHAAPSGFEVFFGRCAEEFAKDGSPDFPKLIAIAAEHGISFPPAGE